MDFAEGVGESASPPRNSQDVIRNDVYKRLIEIQNEEALSIPDFREQLDAHFNRFPSSYGMDLSIDTPEVVLVHRKLLEEAKDTDKRPAFHIRFLECQTSGSDDGDEHEVSSAPIDNVHLPNRRNNSEMSRANREAEFTGRKEASDVFRHEIIFSTADKPKLLSQLSALLSDIGLNIREARVFSTSDGYSLDVFVVDGWEHEATEGLYAAIRKAANEVAWSGPESSESEMLDETNDIPVQLEESEHLDEDGDMGENLEGLWQGPIMCFACGYFDFGDGCRCANPPMPPCRLMVPRVPRLRGRNAGQ